MNNNYLIPANSKRSMLMFGLFTGFDLGLLIAGIATSFFLLLLVPAETVWQIILILLPGLICSFLVLPIPNYHNMLTVFKLMFVFFTTNQKLRWKGWCYLDGEQK